MLMVVFGAGASYDSWPSGTPDKLPRDKQVYRPPLAKELFLPYPEFRKISAKYPLCQTIIPYLESQENIEAILERFRDEAGHDDQRRHQLVATQFYIRDLIAACQGNWHQTTLGVTNYRTLVDQSRAFLHVCFVTFNYDTLLEDALSGIGYSSPPSIRTYQRLPCLQAPRLN